MSDIIVANPAAVKTVAIYHFLDSRVDVEFDERDPQTVANSAPGKARGFTLYDIVKAVVIVDEETVTLTSSPRNWSKTYYIDATLLSKDEVTEQYGKNSVIDDMVRRSHNDGAIFCRHGNFYPYQADMHEFVYAGRE